MEIMAFLALTIKELLMQYGLWQISFAVAMPILVFTLPKLVDSVANLIKVLK